MAPQLLGYYWVSSWPRLPQVPPWPCSSHFQRRRVLRLAPPLRRAGAIRVVADAGPALALDRGHGAVEIQFPTEEEGAAGNEEDDEAVGEREKMRRLRISQANKGNTPWNKGRKHSPETLQRIRERTRLAMQDPKVKKKLMNLGHAQSEETKIKISLGVRRGWCLRLQKLMVQDGCFVEWRDMIADAARKGFAGGVPFQWNSHKILTEQLRQEWLEKLQKRRSMPRPTGNRRAPKSPEQRRKIAEAIAAKWLDQEYRDRVCNAINSYHGTSAGSKVPRKPRTPREPGAKSEAVKRKPLKNRAVSLEDVHVKTAPVKRKKSTTPYKDPMAGEKLEMITKIRAQRTSLEIEKKEAIKRARSLIVEAEKAADALETVAATNPFAQASLIEARKLVTEARISLECIDDDEGPAESSSDDTSDESGVSERHNYDLENHNNVNQQENKPVNGMKLPPSNVNGMDFYFDVSALGETEQLSVYQRIENSMERAYLLPSASSTAQDVNGKLGTNDLHLSQSLANNDQIDQIAAETTDDFSAEPPEDVSSPGSKSKMRWVRGRLVEVEE
ncbi:hypothetical protein QYE76_010913 [Lolium multiflorum]|uniref:Nuclease associated modular domain-containing protein n=1 Tax=Lolium multiflorum TaxID=4521 RepID=A0AAD8X2K0_LOLMU|nr:hypothetical protein QYE76_010913 [Lolium multiflorum]